MPDDFDQFFILKTSTRHLFKSIITSPFTILLLLFCILLQILLVITEYEYMFGLQKFFQHSDGRGLTEFIGKLYLFGATFNIFFGIFLYGRLLKKAGLNNVLLLVPVFFTSLYLGWSFSSHLALTVMGFIAVEGVLVLVEDNNFTLLLNAVPLRLKGKIRIVCESMIEPFGILISSILIMVFQQQSKILGFCLSLLMLGVGLVMRAYYTKGIFYNLISHLINFQEPKHSWETQLSRKDYNQSKKKFLQQFLNLKTNEQFFILECALRFNDKRLLHSLMGKITKLSSEVKIQVIQILCDYPNDISRQFQVYFQYWIKQDTSLHKHLVFHFAKMDLIKLDQIEKSSCPYLRASYALTQSRYSENSSAKEDLSHMLSSKSEDENRVAIDSLRFMKDPSFNMSLMNLLEEKPHLREPILKTLSTTIDATCDYLLPTLLAELESESHISNRYLLVSCIEKTLNLSNLPTVLLQTIHWKEPEKRDLAKAVHKMGYETAPLLVEMLQNPKYTDKVRLFAGQILSKIDKKVLKTAFNEICSKEIRRAYLYYYHYITIQKSYPYSILNLLEQALKHSYDSILDFIIQIQAFIQDFDKGEILTQSLHSTNPKTYSQAQETLQKMSPRKLYIKMQPLIEAGHEKLFFKSYHNQKLPILSLDELLDLLEHSSSRVNRMIVISLKSRLNIDTKAVKATSYFDKLPDKEVIRQ